MKYYLEQQLWSDKNAGGKASNDIQQMLESVGYLPVPYLHKSGSSLSKIIGIFRVHPFLLSLGTGNIVLWVMHENGFKMQFIYAISHIKHFKVICFVNDIFGLWQSKDEKTIARQIHLLDLSDVILAPNQNAINKLSEIWNLS